MAESPFGSRIKNIIKNIRRSGIKTKNDTDNLNEVKPSAGKQVIEHKIVHTPQHAQVSDPPKPQKAQISDPQKKVPPPVPPSLLKRRECSTNCVKAKLTQLNF